MHCPPNFPCLQPVAELNTTVASFSTVGLQYRRSHHEELYDPVCVCVSTEAAIQLCPY